MYDRNSIHERPEGLIRSKSNQGHFKAHSAASAQNSGLQVIIRTSPGQQFPNKYSVLYTTVCVYVCTTAQNTPENYFVLSKNLTTGMKLI